jgi:hypothetical protein
MTPLDPDPLSPDTGSEYGRLLAERDRLIAAGVDPAELLVPDRPRSDPLRPPDTDDEPWPLYPPERSHWPYLRPGEAAGLIVVGLVALAAGLFAATLLWLQVLYRRG